MVFSATSAAFLRGHCGQKLLNAENAEVSQRAPRESGYQGRSEVPKTTMTMVGTIINIEHRTTSGLDRK